MMITNDFDAIVVGAGPAGLAAALTLGRSCRRTLVLDSGAPRNAPAAHMQNVIGRDGTPPARLRADARAELATYPTVEVRDEVAVAAEPGFAVTLAGGAAVRARALVLATGVVDDLPPIPGLREAWGRTVLHCPYCHGFEQRGKTLAVLGAGPHQMFIATLVQRYSPDVAVLANGGDVADPDVLAARGIAVHERPVARIEDGLVVFDDGSSLARGAIFAGGPIRPHATLAADLGCETFDDGLVVVDDFGRTSVPGVYAAGDGARRPSQPGSAAQVMVAAATGLMAGVAADQELHAADTGLPAPLPAVSRVA